MHQVFLFDDEWWRNAVQNFPLFLLVMREKYSICCSIVVLFFFQIVTASADQQYVNVTTQLGVVRGTEENGYNLFKSIPFALPPTGSRR